MKIILIEKTLEIRNKKYGGNKINILYEIYFNFNMINILLIKFKS